MKALTIRQPWASLIAVGVKTIETRSWSTSYRGPIAIHAGATRPAEGMEVGRWTVERWRDEPHRPCLIGGGDWRTPGSVVNPIDLPLGAVVATAVLTDCVPMVDGQDGPHDEPCLSIQTPPGDMLTLLHTDRLLNADDQFPFGDFTPGRWAWLLDDVTPLAEPVPAKGRLGLWEWAA